ncbi:MAG: RecQ family ATP-dependent DNA helicase [Deltaproteobacteria bacterium HGW-Deltaproteobacteria-12]|jgi:ATP-dependent DNA helicase RecQ|nr:MAG: RecQ family ATP-dependent DNA helicase [Deltaproteobacteria bacterium HGW-Deltaproteobacteria-12]
MQHIAFFDTEVDPTSRRILDIGCVKDDGRKFHSNSISGFIDFIRDTPFICGHNICNHDLHYIREAIDEAGVPASGMIDTLYLSPLLFPARPYHALLKDDKLQSDDLNNPLNDSIKARDLFHDECSVFHKMDDTLKKIFYLLLHDKKEFLPFFRFIGYEPQGTDTAKLIRDRFSGQICEHANLLQYISERPVEAAYCLALIHCGNRHSITPRWVLKNYPAVEHMMDVLRNKPCLTGCLYCNEALDIHKGLKRFFGFDSYRTYAGEPLQERAVQAAVDNKSLLAVFPTGGGKSLTFQIPALMSAENTKGLTVVISPLQSLMKDQVDNLEKAGISDAVTINGMLDPIERAKSFERVEDGSASILYISPESLRSITIERLLLGRKIVRVVIDEAHCFSAWGQDFRVDYLYIGDFIKSIQKKKNLEDGIPVSCFTATAKPKVIEDIVDYFREKLLLNLEVLRAKASRTNLHYKVFEKDGDEEKYNTLRALIEEKKCPTIVYVSRTRKAYQLAERLTQDGLMAKPYHGKMNVQEKAHNQDAFIAGEVDVMVATSAFGMGVDKRDVGRVVHYDISDSLENYIQEAGRAGRDDNISAECLVLFNDEDLSKHFILLNQTKLNIKEIQQVWKAVKSITQLRSSVSNSALEIARKAGWDDNVAEIETRVKTAIAALEESGYLKRGQNMPRIYANSILTKTAQEAIEKINASDRLGENQKIKAIRIIKKLFSSKSRRYSNEEVAESRIDYISDHLGIVKEEVIAAINQLRELKILADAKDLTAFIRKGENKNNSLKIVETYGRIERFLLPFLEDEEKTYHLKELNELAQEKGCDAVAPNKIKTILNFWAIKNWIKSRMSEYSRNHIAIQFIQPKKTLKDKLEKRHGLACFIVEYLFEKSKLEPENEAAEKEEVLIEFSVHELKDEYEKHSALFKVKVSIEDIEDTLFYLSRIEAVKIEGGFLVVYNQLTINRLEQDNKRRYKVEDYRKLDQFYENKVQQIHIVGEYARKMLGDYQSALQFVEDYFRLNYHSFLNKYFKGSHLNEIRRNITPAKFRQLFGELTPTQLNIIKDNQAKFIAVAAGPGSGKTKVLVHKLASLLLMEDVKHEQLLMLTFSRAAATEFKKRLLALIGNAALYIEIKTFHSYCFDLLGKVGSLEKSDAILKKTVEKIKNREVESSRITKTVLVIDEAQDMDANEFALINALMEQNEEMRVIAVGDDDQNIFEFRGASAKYLVRFIQEKQAVKYELIENFRSKNNLVEFTNAFAKTIRHRLKTTSVVARQRDNGLVKLVKGKDDQLTTPLVEDLLTSDLSGTTCVLTRTNEEALQIVGCLNHKGMPAKLVQTNDGFSLFNLQEVRFFLNRLNLADDVFTIGNESWEKAKQALINTFCKSSKLDICANLIKDFEVTNPKQKYKSDLDVFIKESKLEDFVHGSGQVILVSTMHKAKGKEFDNVFMMLTNHNVSSDEDKRLLYVAMTRAKQRLNIYFNGDHFKGILAAGLERQAMRSGYLPLAKMVMHLTHKDVNLGYFKNVQKYMASLMCGDSLVKAEDGWANPDGQLVLKFSRRFHEKLIAIEKSGFILHEVKVGFILYWKEQDAKEEVKIILPELYFSKLPR